MAKQNNTVAKKKSAPKKRKTESSSKEIKVIIELRMPQNGENGSHFSRTISRSSNFSGVGTRALATKTATVTLTPVNDIHIVEIEANTQQLAADEDVPANQPFNASAQVSPSRPVSLVLEITGTPNTLVAVEFALDGNKEFKGDLFIPNSGRLAIQKNIL